MQKSPSTPKHVRQLYEAILELKTLDECKSFFRDLCTLSEISAMAERFQVAKLLQHRVPYREICKRTGSSTATITRVAHWLKHGKGGYELILERLKNLA